MDDPLYYILYSQLNFVICTFIFAPKIAARLPSLFFRICLITIQYFGLQILLYTELILSNFCLINKFYVRFLMTHIHRVTHSLRKNIFKSTHNNIFQCDINISYYFTKDEKYHIKRPILL